MTQADGVDQSGVDNETHEPNEYGFAGGATAPQPGADRSAGHGAEDIAVPAGDLTGAISGAMDEATNPDDATR